MSMYRIQRGDTLSGLASKFKTSVPKLLKANPQINNAGLIRTGAALQVPGDHFVPAQQRRATDGQRAKAPAHSQPAHSGHAHSPKKDTFAPGSSSRLNGSINVPAALRRFGNGRVPSSALTSIGIGGHRLYAPAAQSFKDMRAAAARDGVQIGVTDSYRSYATQVDLVRRKGLYKNGGLAATPGTSNHGWGMALDVDTNSRGTAWLRANAARYGFATIPREPWHWEYRR